MPQGDAENIHCVGGLVIKVGFIDLKNNTIEVLLNPNIQHYQATKQSQILQFECNEDTRITTMTPASEPWNVPIEGTVYRIQALGIGEEFVKGVQIPYCEFEVSW